MHSREELLCHIKTISLSTRMVYTHVLQKGGQGVKSPIDFDGLAEQKILPYAA